MLAENWKPSNILQWGFPSSLAGKESACSAGDHSLVPGSGRSPGEGISYPPTPVFLGFPGGSDGKKSTCSAGEGLGGMNGENSMGTYTLSYVE